ncbi:hypothetical protein Pmani_012738 [Petrolisthes manimaculis]|uniref:Uncharacterized protein n=1 Tax=Petrolisthes manimaculis TaxID=1843537 RepID=A0AAE1PYS4_9EUCA|nr:hypothetical protein Pmani_012738 [Petrolisthes manimaculis]
MPFLALHTASGLVTSQDFLPYCVAGVASSRRGGAGRGRTENQRLMEGTIGGGSERQMVVVVEVVAGSGREKWLAVVVVGVVVVEVVGWAEGSGERGGSIGWAQHGGG